MKSTFLYRFSKNSQISIFMKIRAVGDELFYADGRTDGQTDRLDEGNSLFRNFANAPKNLAFFFLGIVFVDSETHTKHESTLFWPNVYIFSQFYTRWYLWYGLNFKGSCQHSLFRWANGSKQPTRSILHVWPCITTVLTLSESLWFRWQRKGTDVSLRGR